MLIDNKLLKEYFRKIHSILQWATTQNNFDTSFIESVQENMIKYRNITARQQQAIDNIIDKCEIDINIDYMKLNPIKTEINPLGDPMTDEEFESICGMEPCFNDEENYEQFYDNDIPF